MKNINDLGLFDDHFLMEKLTKLGDPLRKLDKFINWKIFESPINEAFKNEDRDLSKGGRPSFNRLTLFKALIIQSLYNLSDDQLEYQIVDRASFKRFLGLKKSDKVPDSKTFWLFREQLIEKDVIMGLFKTFNETLDAAGVLSNQGKHVKADTKTKLIEEFIVTDASVHDCLRRYFVVASYGTIADGERRGTTALC